MKSFRIVIFLFLGLGIASLMLSAPVKAFDLFGDQACYTTDSSGNKMPVTDSNGNPPPTCQQAQSEGGANNRITGPKNVINIAANILALAAGIGAIIMIIIGGFTMVTSGGNSEAVTGARRRIVGAIAGLIVIALAWVIIRFVTDRLIQ